MSAQLNLISSWCLRLYFVFTCFEGVLRFELDKLGLGPLFYSRDAFLMGALLTAIADGALIRNLPFAIASATLLITGGVVGIWSCSLFQVVFGFKLLLPACTGIAFGCSRLELPHSTRQASLLCLACLAGVSMNTYWGQFPWTGGTQDFMGIEVVGSREWYHNTGIGESVIRPAGFSRASFCAASQLMILGIFVAVRSFSRWRWFFWTAVLAGLILTTSKGMLIAWVVATVALIASQPDRGGRWAARGIVCSITSLMVAIPLLTLLGDFEKSRTNAGTVSAALTDSFIERIGQMWPEAFALTQSGTGGIYLGRGVGGVGSAAYYFQPEFDNAGDNMFVYLFMEFGLLSIVIVSAMIRGMIRLEKRSDPNRVDNSTLWMLGVSALTYGIVGNVVEDGLLSFCIGAAIGRGMSTGWMGLNELSQE